MNTPGQSKTLTYREAIVNAQKRVKQREGALEDALKERNDLLRIAADNGASLRALAAVVGISAAGVHRAIGHKGSVSSEAILDTPLDWAGPA